MYIENMNWKDLPVKERFTYSTALLAFIAGWVITFCGFFVEPIGVISDGVLFVLGQALLYCGSVLGISTYLTSESRDLKTRMNQHFIDMENARIQREQIRYQGDVDEIPHNDNNE